MATVGDRLVFPAPAPTYTKETLKRYLCWIPWNEAVSPERVDDERYAEGIPCMWLPAPKAAGVILFCHGNAEDLGMSFAFLRHMRDQFKMNILAIEYPGYGLLKHIAPSETAIKEVVLTVFRFVLDELKVAYEQIILFGRSIGSGPATYIASRYPVGGLILVAAFASIREVIKSLAGSLIARAFDERFPNISLIGNVSCPTLFIHGEKDSLVPPSQSVALFKQCRARKLLITPPSMEHNTNLFTDASYLAVPAINFFGLPGYQQESPPKMPQSYFEDGRQAFNTRRQSNKKFHKGKENEELQDWPWFVFCGCPTNKGYRFNGENLSRHLEWEMDSSRMQRREVPNGDQWGSDVRSLDKEMPALAATKKERWQDHITEEIVNGLHGQA
mmetsp:Transcript_65212/g.121565  ORF Transcript_65212/g.121565 Transcript_65212/m.121565 type:complete len:387 (-) Transcript_65212:88-1248(-)